MRPLILSFIHHQASNSKRMNGGFRVLCSLCGNLLVYDSEIPKNYSLIEIYLHILYGIPFLKLNIEQLVIFSPEDTEKSLLLKLNDLYLTISKVFAVYSKYSDTHLKKINLHIN